MKYDLHTHTKYSDGELDVAGNVERAITLGLNGIAITDHDNTESWAEIDKGTYKIPVIKGVELSTFYNGVSVHVLGYYKNDGGDHSELDSFLKMIRKEREERVLKIIDLLKQFDIEITYDEVAKYADGSIGRPHIVQAILAKYPDRGYTDDSIFERFIGNGKPAYVPTHNLDTKEAIKLLHANHCIVILAHPLLIKPEKLNYKDLMKEDFDGIEVFYPYANKAKCKMVLKFAKGKGWLITGGSDFHGPVVRNTMGEAYCPDEYLGEFLERINMKKKN